VQINSAIYHAKSKDKLKVHYQNLRNIHFNLDRISWKRRAAEGQSLSKLNQTMGIIHCQKYLILFVKKII